MVIRGRARANEADRGRKDIKKRKVNETGRGDDRFARFRCRNITGISTTNKEERGETESRDRGGWEEKQIEKERDKLTERNPRKHWVIEKMSTKAKKKGRVRRNGFGSIYGIT